MASVEAFLRRCPRRHGDTAPWLQRDVFARALLINKHGVKSCNVNITWKLSRFVRQGFSTISCPHPVKEEPTDTHSKALRINIDPRWYGTFAEIGAGQEVVRWFFRVGGAAGTVAKSISAYDMKVSDAIYGHVDRYVSRNRLQAMLDYEFGLDIERLARSAAITLRSSLSPIQSWRGAIAGLTSATAGWESSFRAAPTMSPARS